MRFLKRMVQGLGVLMLFALLTLLFLPKERLLNALLETLTKQHVTLCAQTVTCGFLGCDLENIDVEAGGMKTAQIARLRIGPEGVLVWNLRPEGVVGEAFAYRLKEGAFNPYNGQITAKGSFGELTGHVDWLKRRLVLTVAPSARLAARGELKQWMRFDGKRYRYAGSF